MDEDFEFEEVVDEIKVEPKPEEHDQPSSSIPLVETPLNEDFEFNHALEENQSNVISNYKIENTTENLAASEGKIVLNDVIEISDDKSEKNRAVEPVDEAKTFGIENEAKGEEINVELNQNSLKIDVDINSAVCKETLFNEAVDSNLNEVYANERVNSEPMKKTEYEHQELNVDKNVEIVTEHFSNNIPESVSNLKSSDNNEIIKDDPELKSNKSITFSEEIKVEEDFEFNEAEEEVKSSNNKAGGNNLKRKANVEEDFEFNVTKEVKSSSSIVEGNILNEKANVESDIPINEITSKEIKERNLNEEDDRKEKSSYDFESKEDHFNIEEGEIGAVKSEDNVEEEPEAECKAEEVDIKNEEFDFIDVEEAEIVDVSVQTPIQHNKSKSLENEKKDESQAPAQDKVDDDEFEFKEVEDPHPITNTNTQIAVNKQEEDFDFEEVGEDDFQEAQIKEIVVAPSQSDLAITLKTNLLNQYKEKFVKFDDPKLSGERYLRKSEKSVLFEQYSKSLGDFIQSTEDCCFSIKAVYDNYSNLISEKDPTEIRVENYSYEQLKNIKCSNSIVGMLPLEIINSVSNSTIKKLYYSYIDCKPIINYKDNSSNRNIKEMRDKILTLQPELLREDMISIEKVEAKTNITSERGNKLMPMAENNNNNQPAFSNIVQDVGPRNIEDYDEFDDEFMEADENSKPASLATKQSGFTDMKFDDALLSIIDTGKTGHINHQPPVNDDQISIDHCQNDESKIIDIFKSIGIIKKAEEDPKEIKLKEIEEKLRQLIGALPRLNYLSTTKIEYPEEFWI